MRYRCRVWSECASQALWLQAGPAAELPFFCAGIRCAHARNAHFIAV
jgi:hypothetical protein